MSMMTTRIDQLLRSLVGVADVRMVVAGNRLRSVHILRGADTQPHQLLRNIVSGLRAGFGIDLPQAQVHVHDERDVFDAVSIAAEVLVAPEEERVPAPPAKGAAKPNGNGGGKPNGNGHGTNGGDSGAHDDARPRGRTNGHVVPDAKPLTVRHAPVSADVIAAATEIVRQERAREEIDGMALERIDVDRRGPLVRCRTVIAVGDRLYSAIAEAPDGATVEAELAARVAVDALRAGGLTTGMLEGVGFITIHGTSYCVATVREAGSTAPRAGTAPMVESMAASATAAVLDALGSFTDARANGRARTHRNAAER